MNKEILILLVDDQTENRLAVKIALEKEKYRFAEATNGEDAIQKCQELKPDVILMDAIMPIMDGFEATKIIRTMNSDFKHTPILMITSLSEQDDKIKALECGVSDFISKPFNKYELIARCRSYTRFSLDSAKRKAAELELKEQHLYLQSIVDSIKDPIMVIKEDYTVDLMNAVVKETLVTKNIADLEHPKCYEISHNRSSPCDGNEHPCPLEHVLQTNSCIKVIHDHSDTKKQYVELSASPLLDKTGKCIGIIEAGRDITEHLDIQEELTKQKNKLDYQAHHDGLTGLANRVLFEDRLNQAILRAKRSKTKIAMFFIDLDKFKPINDNYGHKAGDAVLKTVSQRIQKKIRQEDTLSRIGGDEFTIIMESIVKEEDILMLSKKIIDVLDEPIDYDNQSLNVSASIGISIYPDDTTNADTLLTYADSAMYLAKNRGRNRSILYSQKEIGWNN